MRCSSRRPAASKRPKSTPSACSENSPKLTPSPSQWAPRGSGRPGQTAVIGFTSERRRRVSGRRLVVVLVARPPFEELRRLLLSAESERERQTQRDGGDDDEERL